MPTAVVSPSKYVRSRRRRWTPEQWASSLARVTAWNEANPDRTEAGRWRGNLRRRYGLTADNYEGMLVSQAGTCAVCSQPETTLRKDGRPKRLAVDHDHNTGKVRGLLCVACNHALGRAGDDPERLERLAEYLRGAA